jgi:hypothetical protein
MRYRPTGIPCSHEASQGHLRYCERPEAEFLGKIQTKFLRVFHLAFHNLLYSFDISISSNSRNLLQFLQFNYCKVYTVKEKGGKPDPLPYGLRNPYKNLKSENSQVYAQKTQRNCTFMNSASGLTASPNGRGEGGLRRGRPLTWSLRVPAHPRQKGAKRSKGRGVGTGGRMPKKLGGGGGVDSMVSVVPGGLAQEGQVNDRYGWRLVIIPYQFYNMYCTW